MHLTQRAREKSILNLQPTCSASGAEMHLVLIEPDKPAHDVREFKCTFCTHAERVIVKFR